MVFIKEADICGESLGTRRDHEGTDGDMGKEACTDQNWSKAPGSLLSCDPGN